MTNLFAPALCVLLAAGDGGSDVHPGEKPGVAWVSAAAPCEAGDSGSDVRRIEKPRLRNYFSSNWAYSVSVKPSDDWPQTKGDCLAELKVQRGSQKGKVLWRRKLVNEWAPRMVLVSGDGKHVVTLDEWGCGGLRNTMVIYGEGGRLVRHLLFSDLLDPEDFKHVKRTKHDLQWARGAKFSFTKDGKRLAVRCGWGKLKLINLDTGRPVRRASPRLNQMLAEAGITPEELAFSEQMSPAETAPAGPPMPSPDPANPADYLAWWDKLNREGVGENDNAAPLYDQAFAKLEGIHDQHELISAAINGVLDVEQAEALAALLEQNAEGLELFARASQMSGYYFQFTAGKDGSLLSVGLPSLAAMRNASKTMIARASLAASQGRYESALDDTVAVLRATGHRSQMPTLIEGLVGVAVQRMTHASLTDLAARAGDELDYAAVAQRLDEADPGTPDFGQAMHLERAMFMDTAQRLFQPDPESGMLVPNAEMVKTYFAASDEDLAAVEKSRLTQAEFDALIEDADGYYRRVSDYMSPSLPYVEARAAFEQLATEVQNDPNPLLRAFVPAVGKTRKQQAQTEAERRMTHLLFDVLAYRQATGELPDSLDVLPGGGDLTLDPMTGDSFVYRRTGDEFTLYSVGADGQDDGGNHNRRGEDGTDLVAWPPQ
jgi:hypothetical protein